MQESESTMDVEDGSVGGAGDSQKDSANLMYVY